MQLVPKLQESISETLESKNFLGGHAPHTPLVASPKVIVITSPKSILLLTNEMAPKTVAVELSLHK